MKILLYFEAENLLKTSGIGRALKHQQEALKNQGIEYTLDIDDDYDILQINTYGLNSTNLIASAKAKNKPVIYFAHSTEEDFKNSFVFSNTISPIFKKRIVYMYNQADHIITPTEYAKNLLVSYGINKPISNISNGIKLEKYCYDNEKVRAFNKYFNIKEEDKVVMGVGLYFERKGLLDFVEIAKSLKDYKFIWFGHTPMLLTTQKIKAVFEDYPSNLIFPGYVKGPIIEGAYLRSNVFFFPSYEETEGIVVLEALASKTNVLLRDIPVFYPWLKDKENCYFGNDNEEFKEIITNLIEKKLPDLTSKGYEVAKDRTLDKIGLELKQVYEKLLGCNNE